MRDARPADKNNDPAAQCVVADDPLARIASRLLLGPAAAIGTDIAQVHVRRSRHPLHSQVTIDVSPARAAQLDSFTAATAGRPVALTIDGRVVAEAIVDPHADGSIDLMVVGSPTRGEAVWIEESLYASRAELLREASERATLTTTARALLEMKTTTVEEKAGFATSCPETDEQTVFVFGCFDGDHLHILRIDAPDLDGLMAVSLAHEMLHAAYRSLTEVERMRVDAMTARAFAAITDQHFRALIASYDELEPGQRANELHSLLATEIKVLPADLEEWYANWFSDRQQVVSAYEAFDSTVRPLADRARSLEARYAQIESELNGMEGRYSAAMTRADALTSQIDDLRAQGRIAESNALVSAQNGAVNEVNSIVRRHNALVSEINSIANEHNSVADRYREIFDALSAVPSGTP